MKMMYTIHMHVTTKQNKLKKKSEATMLRTLTKAGIFIGLVGVASASALPSALNLNKEVQIANASGTFIIPAGRYNLGDDGKFRPVGGGKAYINWQDNSSLAEYKLPDFLQICYTGLESGRMHDKKFLLHFKYNAIAKQTFVLDGWKTGVSPISLLGYGFNANTDKLNGGPLNTTWTSALQRRENWTTNTTYFQQWLVGPEGGHGVEATALKLTAVETREDTGRECRRRRLLELEHQVRLRLDREHLAQLTEAAK